MGGGQKVGRQGEWGNREREGGGICHRGLWLAKLSAWGGAWEVASDLHL